VMALEVLDVGEAWAGYLNTAYGAGAVVLGMLGVLLVGRRLGPVIIGTAVALGVALAASAAAGLVVVVVLLAVVGGARTLFHTAVRVLLQRAVPPQRLAALFGLSEGLNMSFLAAGSVFVPLLVVLGGPTFALVGTAALLPVAVALRAVVLFRIDDEARLPVVEIALLQQIPLFGSLPSPTLEALAASMEEVDLAPGTVLVEEGDEGDYYYAIGQGSVEIRRGGAAVRELGRADGLGEIALLRSTPRTATAVATSRVTAFRLDRDSFLTAVVGHPATLENADAVVREHHARDTSRRDGSAGPDG
jgi:MFS family permease